MADGLQGNNRLVLLILVIPSFFITWKLYKNLKKGFTYLINYQASHSIIDLISGQSYRPFGGFFLPGNSIPSDGKSHQYRYINPTFTKIIFLFFLGIDCLMLYKVIFF